MKSIVMYVFNKSHPYESSSKLFHLSGHITQDFVQAYYFHLTCSSQQVQCNFQILVS